MSLPEFHEFPKIPRWSKEVVITEKLDGTNAGIYINEDKTIVHAASRNRWISIGDDNFGFASWVEANREELKQLGHGMHHGEWWGKGIQRGYGLKEKRFSLFAAHRWTNERPACCDVVPILYAGPQYKQGDDEVLCAMDWLDRNGSAAVQGWEKPEGIIIFHTASRQMYKMTFDMDGGKWAA
jgi:hypothetical protein